LESIRTASTTDSAMSNSRSWTACVAAVAFALLVVAIPAGRAPVWHSNEARYMVLAQDILERGHWVIPDLRGEPYLNKPQLFFWAVAATSVPGGAVTERTAALPAAVSSIATVAAIVAIGASAWGWRAGMLAGCALASMIGFFVVGHRPQADVMVTAWTWWALFFLLRARRAGWAVAPLVGFYVCVGAAIISKGPSGFVGLVGALVAVAATDGWRALARLRPGIGAGVLAVLLMPWYGPYLTGHRPRFVGDVVVGHYGGWVFRRGLMTRVESLWVLAYALPWSIFLAAAVAWWRRAADAERRLVGVWTLVLWALIGLSGIHRVHYLFPIYPGLALLAGEFVARAGARDGARALRVATWGFAALALAVGAAAFSPLARHIGREGRPYMPDGIAETALLVGLLLVGAAAAIVAARRQAFVAAGLAVALATGAVFVVEGVRYPTRFARDFDVRPIATAARAVTPPGGTVVGFPDIGLNYDFYLDRTVVELDRPRVEQLLREAPRGALIVPRSSWTELQSAAHPAWRVIASHRVAGREILVVGARSS
jgi:4-amino-4-deoxy-L-arabinose transferase-like glycosyltransferase